jgi:hypothetical protein
LAHGDTEPGEKYLFDPVNVMAVWVMAEKFLATHLGGRHQEAMSPEVAKRLQEITVNPKTVKLATNPTDK